MSRVAIFSKLVTEMYNLTNVNGFVEQMGYDAMFEIHTWFEKSDHHSFGEYIVSPQVHNPWEDRETTGEVSSMQCKTMLHSPKQTLPISRNFQTDLNLEERVGFEGGRK